MQPVRFKASVLKVSRATPTVALIELSTKNAPNFTFVPGQFIMVHMEIDGKKISKSYSISSGPQVKGKIEICVKEVPLGKVSRRLCILNKGEELEISGPHGLFTLKEPLQRDVVFAATGTGISSIKSMVEYIFDKGTDKQVWLSFGIRNESEFLYKEHLEWLASKHPNFHFFPVMSQSSEEWKGEKGYVQKFMHKAMEKHQNYDLYICGVVKAVDEIKQLAEQMSFPKNQIHFEKYT